MQLDKALAPTLDDLGLTDYSMAVARQLELVERAAAGGSESIIFCTHPPVVTLGRQSTPEDLIGWSGEVAEASRGGRATYHGPNQLVVYPILDLRRERSGLRVRDVHAYLRWLESVTVETLKAVGIANAEARTTPMGETSLTGVWVGERKIASIGIAVRKWITYHGVAINVEHDPNAFNGIRACGFQSGIMTSIEKELGKHVSKVEVQRDFVQVLRAHKVLF